MKIIVTTFTILILIFTPYNAFAQEDKYEIIGENLTQDPTVCVLEPQMDIKDGWKKLSKYTRGAVLDWEKQLNQYNRVKNVWNLDLQLISLEKQNDSINCNITIEFYPKPQNENDEFKILGYTMNNSKNDSDIVIYYLNIELERVDYTEPSGQDGFYYSVVEWIPSYGDYLTPEEPLKMTIKHELGHALGLGHYVSHDVDKIQSWYDGVQRPPSIMIPTEPTKVISADITQLDVKMLTQIYGKDGFYSEGIIDDLQDTIIPDSKRITLPDWIKNNARWWADGIISNKDFALGIEHMIKNEIIIVGTTGTNNFSVQQVIPEWVKSNAAWWADGLIPSDEFVKGLQYLVKNGIIRV